MVPCGLVEPCGFMAKATKVDEKASDEEVVALISLHVIIFSIDKGTPGSESYIPALQGRQYELEGDTQSALFLMQ